METHKQMAMLSLLLLLLLLLSLATDTSGCKYVTPPTVQCQDQNAKTNCQIFNNQGVWEDRSDCKAAVAFFPRNESEAVSAVASAVSKSQRINVISGLAHSHTPLMCVGNGGAIISTKNLRSTILVNKAAMTLTADAGVIMRELLDAAALQGVTLAAVTSWDGVSAAGSASAGAHGSGLSGSSIADQIVGVRIVVPASASEGFAKVVELKEGDENLKAAMLSLGMLGVISKVTFRVQSMFKRKIFSSLEDDGKLEDSFLDFLRGSEFADMYWHIGQGKVLMRKVDRVAAATPGNGINKSSYQASTVAQTENGAVNYDKIASAEDSTKLCSMMASSLSKSQRTGWGYLNDGVSFTGYPVTGFNHKMATTGGCESYDADDTGSNTQQCGDNMGTLARNQSICSWDRRVKGRVAWSVELRVPLGRARDAIIDLKKLRQLSPQGAMCGLDGSGIIMRTLPRSSAYMGTAEDTVTFELIYHRSSTPFTPTWNMDVYQEMEQLLVEKYGARLHWGKSGGHLFEGMATGGTVDSSAFMAAKRRLDPQGLFFNDWTERLFGIGGKKVEKLQNGCALEKLCKCRVDAHCAPSAGYFCRPGRLWTNASVCRKGK